MNALQRKAFDYFVSMGWSPAQSAGIVANLWAESRLDPAAVGDGGAAYGIAQWHSSRQAGFAGVIGHDIHGSSLEEQLAYVHAELQSTEKRAGDALSSCTTARDAGAYVSTLYERPADTEGEAAKRGALAQELFDQAGAPTDQPEPPPTAAPQPQGSPMGAIATFLPLIMQLIPGLNKIPILNAAVSAVSGQPATPGGPVFTPPTTGSMHSADYLALAQIILDTFVKAVPGAANPAMAVGMAQADPAVAQKASEAVMSHPDVVAQLNAQVPVFDAIAKYDAATNAAQIAGANAAAARAATDKWDMTQTVVLFAGFAATVIVLSLLGAIIYQACFGERKIDTALVGLAGPLLAISMNLWREVFSYRFDGTPASNATAAVNQQIAAMNAAKP